MKVSELKNSDTCYRVLRKHDCIVKPRTIGDGFSLKQPICFKAEDDVYSDKYGWHQRNEFWMTFPTVEQAMRFARDNAIADLGYNVDLEYTRLVITQFYKNKVIVDGLDSGMTFTIDVVDEDTKQAISENKFEYELDNDGEKECEEIINKFHEKYMVPTDKLNDFLKKLGLTNK